MEKSYGDFAKYIKEPDGTFTVRMDRTKKIVQKGLGLLEAATLCKTINKAADPNVPALLYRPNDAA